MSKPVALASLLLISSALVAPAAARAQSAPGTSGQQTPPVTDPSQAGAAPAADPQTTDAPADAQAPVADGQAPAEEPVDVSIPGQETDIVVRGTRTVNVVRATPQVVSVLSTADIARTGEGDIAGALSRVTGLSVVGNGFVYVRGLGDRYSLALLNGSPLPSPEPLRRVVPLDLFPTSVIASSLVQKSYSVNFPGEFGGGVINLTTKSVPKDGFLTVGGSIGADTVTTGQLGYTYFGSSSDWTGFDNGTRNFPPLLRSFYDSGNRISQLSVEDQGRIAAQLVNGRNSVVQRNTALPPNWGANITGGKSWDVGAVTLGLIATAGYSNKWRTRDVTQQTANAIDLSSVDRDYERVITGNRIVVDGLVGLSAEFDRNKIRWTTLYVRDTLKEARIGIGNQFSQNADTTFQEQDTAWYERQLIDTQVVAELKVTPELSVDLRGAFANTQREAPNEFRFEYTRSNNPADPYGAFFTNSLNGRNDRPGRASVAYSDLNENLWSGGIDITYKLNSDITASVGYTINDTNRRTERRDFQFQGNGDIPIGVTLLRPDLLLSPAVIDYYNITLIDATGSNPAFRATLRNHGVYAQLQAQIIDDLSINVGVRFENADQRVRPIQVYNVAGLLPPETNLRRDYWLPAGTLTYQLADDMQIRLSASKTIARPQFRELVFQTYYDSEFNSQFQGNPLLVDSQLFNIEGRYEWYFAREQRISVAGFYKKIDNPIETYASFDGNTVITRFANAPRATLYGGEIETQKYFDLDWLSQGDFFAARRLVAIANYTYTKSRISVNAGDTTAAFPFGSTSASDFFVDGRPLTGQSDHLVNLELGLESKSGLSQQTLLFAYASQRVTRRGPSGQPDIVERPGIHLDFVARQGVKIAGINTEMKLEIRNITGTEYQELQDNGTNRIYYNRYNVGRFFNFGLSVNF